MALFDYSAIDNDGKKKGGRIDAPSEELAIQKLEEEQLELLSIGKVKEPIKIEDFLNKYRPVSPMTLVYFSRQLATMLDSGLPPLRCLSVLEQQETSPKFKSIIADIIAKVESGVPMAEAMGDHGEVFGEVYVAMIAVGEASGNLDKALLTLATELEKTASIKRQVKSAMTYPKAVLSFAFLVVCGMLLTIVPRFATIFEDAAKINATPGAAKHSGKLPMITQVVLDASHFLFPVGNKNAMWLLSVSARFFGLFLFIMVIKRVIRKTLTFEGPRYQWDAFKLKAPMKVGPLIQKVVMTRFTRTFASLLEAGVPPQEAMEIVARTTGNRVVSDAVLEAREKMLNGQEMASTLAKSSVFPPMVVRMIEAGEEAGNLQIMLSKIADFYEEEVEAAIKSLSSIVEPIMLILVGAVIGFIIIAIYMPILTIYDQIG